jgi:hypothetical protein
VNLKDSSQHLKLMKEMKRKKEKEEEGILTPIIFQFNRSIVKYDTNMSRK